MAQPDLAPFPSTESVLANPFTFQDRVASNRPRAWERAPKSPFANRHNGKKVWKRYDLRGQEPSTHKQGAEADDAGSEGTELVDNQLTASSRPIKRLCLKHALEGGQEARVGNRKTYFTTLRDGAPGTPRRKHASRKSLRPDRSRPKSVLPPGTVEDALLSGHFPVLDNDVLEDALRPTTALVSEVPQVLPESAGATISAMVILPDGAICRPHGMASMLEELDTSIQVVPFVDEPGNNRAFVRGEVLGKAAEEVPPPLEVDSNCKEEEKDVYDSTFAKEESTNAVSTSEAKCSETAARNGDHSFVWSFAEQQTTCSGRIAEDGEERDPISCSLPEMTSDESSGPCTNGITTNPTTTENINITPINSELKDDLAPLESVQEEASMITSLGTSQCQSISELDNSPTEVAEQNSVPATSDVTEPEGLTRSPNASAGGRTLDMTVNEDIGTSFSGAKREDPQSEKEKCKFLKSARSNVDNVATQGSPIAHKHRHSIRLSMEDLTSEEITEAVIVFHDYKSRKSSERIIDGRQAGNGEAADQTPLLPPEADSIVMGETEDTSEKGVEASIGRTRSGARFSDDTTMLKDFLSRAQARKLAQPSNIPTSAPKPITSTKTPRQALTELDNNSPSPQKQQDIATRPGTPPGKGRLAAVEFDEMMEDSLPEPMSCRRSTRARSPAPSKTTPGVPSFIPVRRADGADPVILQKSAAQELAIVTRANTRRNKGQAKIPKLTLQALPTEGSEMAVAKHGNKDAKTVGWDEKLAYFQVPTESADNKEEKRPRVRRLRGLGAVNGTPAPKKMMADVNISYGTPAPKRRGKLQW